MSRLAASKRARMPASAFAYVDSRGRRRLPIHDESHVRNALARFSRVAFENDQKHRVGQVVPLAFDGAVSGSFGVGHVLHSVVVAFEDALAVDPYTQPQCGELGDGGLVLSGTEARCSSH